MIVIGVGLIVVRHGIRFKKSGKRMVFEGMIIRKCSGAECHEDAQVPEGLHDEIRGGAGTVEQGVELDGEDGQCPGRGL